MLSWNTFCIYKKISQTKSEGCVIQLTISTCWLTLKRGGGAQICSLLVCELWLNLLTQGINNAELVNGNCSQKGVMCAGDGTGKMARTHTPPSRQQPGLLLRNGAEQHHKRIQLQSKKKKKVSKQMSQHKMSINVDHFRCFHWPFHLTKSSARL